MMRTRTITLLTRSVAPLLAAITLSAQSPGTAIERIDPALDRLVAPGTKPELLKGDYFGFAEGGVWIRDGGFFIFSDIAANRIYKWTPDGKLSTFLDNSGFTGTDLSKAGMEFTNGRIYFVALGSNGTTVDSQGRVVFCAHGDRAIKRLEKNGTVTVLANNFEGKKFNGPNDLVMRSDDVVYFSDNIGGLRGGLQGPNRELPYFGLFMVKDGKVTLVEKDPMGQNPNGLGLSPDERYLYVGAGPYIFRYELQKDGTPANRQVLVDLTKVQGGVDGLEVDVEGNIYFVGPGGVRVVTAAGRHLGTISVPHAANLAFGGADGKTLFVTARTDLYKMSVKVGGRPPGPSR